MCTISIAVSSLYKTVNKLKASKTSDCLIRPKRFHHYVKQPIEHGKFWHRSAPHKQIFFPTHNKIVGLKYFLKNIKINAQVI